MNSPVESAPAPKQASVRTFVAVPLPASLLDRVAEVQQRLKARPEARPVRWNAADQLHLTLKFLGNVPPGELTRLAESLDSVGAELPAFELGLAGIGCFPHPGNPRVVWIGVTGAVSRLAVLQRRIESATCGFGDHTEEQREFHPHLTIGRVKSWGEGGRRLGSVLARERVPELGVWPVQQVDLMQSDLRPQGAVYTRLHSARLCG